MIHAYTSISHENTVLSKAPSTPTQVHIDFYHQVKYRILSLKSGSGMVDTSQVWSLECKSYWAEDLRPKDTSYLLHSILSPHKLKIQ